MNVDAAAVVLKLADAIDAGRGRCVLDTDEMRAVLNYVATAEATADGELPVERCNRVDPHGVHRHSPVASRMCPGVPM